MAPDLKHDQLQELLGVFALDALDPFEADAVKAHLDNCPRCRDEVAQHQQTAALIANTGEQAPPRVWDAIATQIKRPDMSKAFTPVPRLDRLVRPGGRTRKRSRLALCGAGIAAVAMAAIAVLSLEVGRLHHQLNHAAATNAPTISAAASSALLDPAAHRLVLAATNTNRARATAEVIVEPSGAAFLFNLQLIALPDSRTYQLWNIIDGRTVSVGLLGPHPSVAAFNLNPAPPTGALAITIEPAGGSVAPTRPAIASTTT